MVSEFSQDRQNLSRTNDGSAAEFSDDSSEPVVGYPNGTARSLAIFGSFAVFAVTLFLLLNSRRLAHAESLTTSLHEAGALLLPPPPPPLQIPLAPSPGTAMVGPPSTQITEPSHAMQDLLVDDSSGQKAPAVVVDLQPSEVTTSERTQSAAATGVPNPAGMGRNAGHSDQDSNEEFAERASDNAPGTSVASQLANLSTIITQGATISGVLETAINSDLPGFTRAVVSRDVRSFDGNSVLIPRGSRLIGQYKNALSMGQSRVFVIWTRVIRPDGVSIQIGSPGADTLGRGGVSGEVNSHFFARFGGAILMSILNAGSAIAAGVPSTQISIGSAAVGTVAGASLPVTGDIPPTIKVDQGSAITIFVARDLDFSGVKPAL